MLKYYKYRIPFKKPFTIAGKEYSYREGIILIYRDEGIEAYGEAAPLPGFSSETIDQVQEVLKINHHFLFEMIENRTAKDGLKIIDQIHQFPSLSFAIDTLLHDLEAKKKNQPLAEHLFHHKNNSLHCNATISILNEKEPINYATQLIKLGFKTLKVKVGDNFDREFSILSAIREKFPALKIRIDANEAWTVDEAITYINSLKTLDIEYCEQPVSAEDLIGLKKVKESVSVPIAADESVRNKKDALEILESKSADILIFKPMLMGTFENIFVTKSIADTHNIEVVFTTALESEVGCSATAAIAQGLGSKKYAHGLATGALLKKDKRTNKWIEQPEIKLSELPGLGISLYWKGLKEI